MILFVNENCHHFMKQKVKTAVQLVSHRTASGLHVLKVNGVVKFADGTIEFCNAFDWLFDVLNTRVGQKRFKQQRANFVKDDPRLDLILRAIHRLKALMETVDEGSRLATKTIQHWNVTLNSYCQIATDLLGPVGWDYVQSNRFSQDPLEVQYCTRIKFL